MKSIDFVKKHIVEQGFNYTQEEIDSATIFDISRDGVPERIKKIIRFTESKADVEFCFSKDDDWDYFSSSTSTHDGTLLFSLNLFDDVLYKVLTGISYPKYKAPTDYTENFDKYKIKCKIGEFVIFNNFGIKRIKGNSFYGQTETVCLPIVWDAEKKD